jgi:hypothetical protein
MAAAESSAAAQRRIRASPVKRAIVDEVEDDELVDEKVGELKEQGAVQSPRGKRVKRE